MARVYRWYSVQYGGTSRVLGLCSARQRAVRHTVLVLYVLSCSIRCWYTSTEHEGYTRILAFTRAIAIIFIPSFNLIFYGVYAYGIYGIVYSMAYKKRKRKRVGGTSYITQ